MDSVKDPKTEKWEKPEERTSRIKKLIEDVKKKGAEGKAQKIQVKILKNRRYLTGSVDLYLTPKFNLVTETDPTEDENDFDYYA